MVSTVLRSRVPVYFTRAPVCSSHGLTMARNASCSLPPQVPMTVTSWPVRSSPGDSAGVDGSPLVGGSEAGALGAAVGDAVDPPQAAATTAIAASPANARILKLRVGSITSWSPPLDFGTRTV